MFLPIKQICVNVEIIKLYPAGRTNELFLPLFHVNGLKFFVFVRDKKTAERQQNVLAMYEIAAQVYSLLDSAAQHINHIQFYFIHFIVQLLQLNEKFIIVRLPTRCSAHCICVVYKIKAMSGIFSRA